MNCKMSKTFKTPFSWTLGRHTCPFDKEHGVQFTLKTSKTVLCNSLHNNMSSSSTENDTGGRWKSYEWTPGLLRQSVQKHTRWAAGSGVMFVLSDIPDSRWDPVPTKSWFMGIFWHHSVWPAVLTLKRQWRDLFLFLVKKKKYKWRHIHQHVLNSSVQTSTGIWNIRWIYVNDPQGKHVSIKVNKI